MSKSHDPGRGNPATLDDFDGKGPLAPGDVLRWRGEWARIADVADFPGVGCYVVVEWIGTRRLPMSLRLEDLAGAEVWHPAPDGVIDLRRGGPPAG